MQGQPEVFGVAFLREVECEEEEGEHAQEDGVDEIQQALEKAAIGGKIQLALEVVRVAEGKSVVGEEAGVSILAECGVDDAHHQSERGYGGIEVQVIEAGDGLILVGRIAMRSLGLHHIAVDEDFWAEPGRAEFERGAVRDGKLDEESKRPVMGSELDMQAEPGVAARGSRRRGGGGRRCGRALCRRNRILVRDFADRWQGIANGPGGVIEGRRGGGEVGCDADAPVLIQGDGRTDGRGVEDGCGGGWGGALG